MPLPGRIEGRESADGLSYEIRQGDTLLKSISIDDAKTDQKLATTIKRNNWEEL